MKKAICVISVTVLVLLMMSISTYAQEVTTVASFKGIQVTGITISNEGRIFVNFPRWRDNVPFSIVEVAKDGSYKPYPDEEWNAWNENQAPNNKQFVCVQSMLADKNKLYVIETSNPQFKGVIGTPKIHVFNLKTNKFVKTYPITVGNFGKNSYVNDLKIDHKRNVLYFTDSGQAGIIVLDLTTGKSSRHLNNHIITSSEVDKLTFKNGEWKASVHSDGIEFDAKNDLLYIHALTGYTLYSIPIKDLMKDDTSRVKKYTTGAPDGLIFDQSGKLYFANLEKDKIEYLIPKTGEIQTLISGEDVKWADSFAIYNGFLYWTNSRINEAKDDISQLEFTVNKIKLP